MSTHMQPTIRSNTFPTCASPSRSRASSLPRGLPSGLPCGHKFPTCVSVPLSIPCGRPSPSIQLRPAFTLVELLVVIVILAMLTGLIGVAASRALATARNAAIKAEIDMLHMAIMNYKNEYGSFPPCSDTTTYAQIGPAARHLARLFPRCTNTTSTGEFSSATALTPATAIYAWLSGYSSDPAYPLTGGARKKLFDFDSSRITSLTYYPSGKSGSPYIYIDSSNYLVSGVIPTFNTTGGTYYAHRVPAAAGGDFTTVTQAAFNPDTFQILCAGLDETFGNDDDISNFWPSTRKDYLDSLSQ